jgi:ribosome-binding ATPase YchF (GTP1/OBG family)
VKVEVAWNSKGRNHVLSCGAGKATRGYDPSVDIVWLRSEIVQWIEGNLMEKWFVKLP